MHWWGKNKRRKEAEIYWQCRNWVSICSNFNCRKIIESTQKGYVDCRFLFLTSNMRVRLFSIAGHVLTSRRASMLDRFIKRENLPSAKTTTLRSLTLTEPKIYFHWPAFCQSSQSDQDVVIMALFFVALFWSRKLYYYTYRFTEDKGEC